MSGTPRHHATMHARPSEWIASYLISVRPVRAVTTQPWLKAHYDPSNITSKIHFQRALRCSSVSGEQRTVGIFTMNVCALPLASSRSKDSHWKAPNTCAQTCA